MEITAPELAHGNIMYRNVMKMKKTLIYLAAAASLLASCSNDIDYTEPNNFTDEIAFSVGNVYTLSSGHASTRASEHSHIDWDAAVHANTLGVFDASQAVFDNQKVTWDGEKWDYTPKKYWTGEALAFLGYMVEEDVLPSASLSKDGNSYTLSFPAAISKPILTSADNTPLISHAPVDRSSSQKLAVPFEMDQTLTGYCLQFQLGEKMGRIRDFVIKSVKIYGDDLPTGGTISRTYTLNGSTWTAEDVTWKDVTTSNVASVSAISIPISLESITVNTHTEWVKWGGTSITDGAFFAIPSADFNPTIEVTYDVYSDASTMTRKDVKSKIILNTTNFQNLASGTTGEIHPIRIKIVPDYLYVLSDDDHATGVLVVGE